MTGNGDGFLSQCRIAHQQYFVWFHLLFDAHQFLHQFLVYLQSASRIQNDRVNSILAGIVQCLLGQLGNVLLLAVRIHAHTQVLAQQLQLVYCGRPIHVASNKQHLLVCLVLQVLRQLGAGGGLAAAVETAQHDYGWLAFVKLKARAVLAQQCHQLVIDDFHHLLAWLHIAQHLLSQAFLRAFVHKVRGDLVVHIRFQQGIAYLLH